MYGLGFLGDMNIILNKFLGVLGSVKKGPVLSLISLVLSFSAFAVNAEGLNPDKCQMEDSVLIIKSDVAKIPAYCFRDRKDIAEVRFESPASLVSIEDYAFLGCENLRKIELPETLKSLGEGSFRECSSLESMTIPSGVTRLPKFLFYWCENLKRVKLPAKLTAIERGCFCFCRSLESVSFPSGLKNIGMNAFSRCESLEKIVVPSSVNELESYAFSDCRNLKKITFPRNGAMLGELILSGCDSVETIYEMSASVPKFECNSFIFEPDETGKYERVRLVVSSGKASAYRNAPGWKLFNIIED